jgi:signal transduction histidine kinase
MTDKSRRGKATETDERLRAERGRTDEEIAKRAALVERDAGQLITETRDRAHEVLDTARAQADQKLPAGPSAASSAIAEERAREDAALRQQYQQADQISSRERDERNRMLIELLGFEREATDKSLLLERAEAEEIVAKRDHFLGMVSHDLRNELGGLALSAARLITNASNDDAGQKVFRTATNIQRITLRMSRLIGDLLDVASIEAGKFTIIAEEHDVSGVMEQLVESFQPVAGAKDISLVTKTVGGSIVARFDQQRILQVLTNLLTNALKFTSPGGKVTVCAERKERDVCLSVQDTGAGIAAERLDAIFDRFAQGGNRDRKGLGLGLYIARRIVETHGGHIWVVSSPGHGSTFHFTLPLAAGSDTGRDQGSRSKSSPNID